ncbi:ssDNA-binding protein, mitochondrial [Aspergillus nanangensis]|uniref:SsDNA-binding protein, mitochondrial n=1 Tax=Aspergillus nanangensis TaxID=2582783 RepID=A0AAD4CWL2_ASPNN|nr:ssDNA-binding protein, mitochondrial [Aspergillus nanangensis]
MSVFTASMRPFASAVPRAGLSARSFSSSASRSVARMIITGRLAAEPELQATSTGQSLVKYAVGSSYGPRDNQKTSWFRIASFAPEGAQRDYLLSLPKGTLVYVEGDASMRQWEDAEGKKQSTLNIVQRSFEVLKRPSNPEDAASSGY